VQSCRKLTGGKFFIPLYAYVYLYIAFNTSLHLPFVHCTVEWVDVGTRPKVKWIYIIFNIKKIRKIEKKVF
jgi:hypothetical protein